MKYTFLNNSDQISRMRISARRVVAAPSASLSRQAAPKTRAGPRYVRIRLVHFRFHDFIIISCKCTEDRALSTVLVDPLEW